MGVGEGSEGGAGFGVDAGGCGGGGCDSGLLIKGTIWLESLFCCSSQPHQSPGRDTFVLVLMVLLHIVPKSMQVL